MSAAKYRKKPVVIEAIRWAGTNGEVIRAWSGWAAWPARSSDSAAISDRSVIVIDTLEGRMTAVIGDWIIRGVHGEFYPCKPDIFEATYEAVE